MTKFSIPLKESLLVGFLKGAESEVPIEALQLEFYGYTLEKLEQTQPIDPSHALISENDSQPSLLVGPLSIGVSVREYQSWEIFRDLAWDTLLRAHSVYTEGWIEGLLLRYVDRFEGENPAAVAASLKILNSLLEGGSFQEGQFTYSDALNLANEPSHVLTNYTFHHFEDEENVEGFIGLVIFDTYALFENLNKRPDEWLEAAHRWQKQAFWRALTPDYLGGPGANCFDAEERSVFERQP
ncbi:TIGR04255 family protein [Microvenator marinus]|uniref:TIGR04255 family protein n=1 Tax=Microvenator marinus TaxID=2600177 RepID=A0A5B8Y1Y5_9DELT|nr:TIGR04255 family protein [Microvenator marinus]QED29966.1 TIGR04255 family protein [Microvenator marinus]